MKKIFLKIKYFFLFLYKKIKYKWENIERDDNFWFLYNIAFIFTFLFFLSYFI